LRRGRAKAKAVALGRGLETDRGTASDDAMEAIAAVKARYCQCLDRKEWDRWGSLFAEDAVMQVGPSAEAAVRGRAAIKKLLREQLKRAQTLHQAWEPEVTEEGPGRVRVVWRMKDRVQTPLYVLEGAGFYEDRYVQTEDGWKIAGVRLHRNEVELRPKSLIMRTILWLHSNGWLKRLSPGADRTLGEALYVGLGPGERP